MKVNLKEKAVKLSLFFLLLLVIYFSIYCWIYDFNCINLLIVKSNQRLPLTARPKYPQPMTAHPQRNSEVLCFCLNRGGAEISLK